MNQSQAAALAVGRCCCNAGCILRRVISPPCIYSGIRGSFLAVRMVCMRMSSLLQHPFCGMTTRHFSNFRDHFGHRVHCVLVCLCRSCVCVHELFVERNSSFWPATLSSSGTALLVPDYTMKLRFEAMAGLRSRSRR